MQFPATLVQLTEKPHHPQWPNGKILRLDLSISCNFQQLWFSWQKSPHPHPKWPNRENSETRSIHFMQFPATLVQLPEKPPPLQQPNRDKVWDWIYPFHAISSKFDSAGRKAPTPQWLNREKFWDWIYPFHAISSNFGSAARKAPPPAAKQGKILRLDLSISCNFQQLWFSWQKSPPPQQPNREKFLDISIPCNFQQLWFSWQKITPSFLSFHERPSLCCTCGIPMVPILQIHTQIPPIQISSLGYQLGSTFQNTHIYKVQDTGSWCRWKACRQPYHNTH